MPELMRTDFMESYAIIEDWLFRMDLKYGTDAIYDDDYYYGCELLNAYDDGVLTPELYEEMEDFCLVTFNRAL